LSQENVEKLHVVTPRENAGVLRRVRDFFEFLEKVRQEMKLVHHPNWQEVCSTTLVVLVFVSLFAMYLRALEWIFSPLDHWLFSR
jgi:preprotein translocase SecE subunit